MKRSKVFELMFEEILKPLPSCMGDGGLQAQIQVDRILTVLEENDIILPILGDGPIPNVEVKNMLIDMGFSIEWEPEND